MTAAALASRPNTKPSAHPVPTSNENVADVRLRRLPGSAQAKFERLRQLESRMAALRAGLYDQRERVREQRDNAVRELGIFDHRWKPERVFTSVEDADGTRRTELAVFPERAALIAKIESLKVELARLSAEQQAANPGVSTENILDWLAGQLPSTQFAPVPVKIGKTETLASNRADQDTLRSEIAAIETAPRTTQEARTAMRAEVGALAEKGRPDVANLFHGGAIGWPTELFVADGSGVHPHIVSATINNAHALAVWANSAAIITELDREIDRQADGAFALTAQEQAAQLTERRAALLNLQRQEEAAVERLEAQGQVVARFCRDPLVLLGIQAA